MHASASCINNLPGGGGIGGKGGGKSGSPLAGAFDAGGVPMPGGLLSVSPSLLA